MGSFDECYLVTAQNTCAIGGNRGVIRRSFASGIGAYENFTLAVPAAHTNITTDEAQANPETSRANLFATQMAHG
ncbi:hypothetical protein D7B12_18085 [Salmonella enterica]|nr:hypothetical protein [Salmonella enterica]